MTPPVPVVGVPFEVIRLPEIIGGLRPRPLPFPLPQPAPDLAPLRFRAETNPLGPAIDLVWELPDPDGPPDQVHLVVLRRERRFPGLRRRGIVAVRATGDDLADGVRVYDPFALEWDIEETREEVTRGGIVATTRQFLYRGTPRDRVLVRSVRREYPPEGGPASRAIVRVVDRSALEPGTIAYYTAFVGKYAWYSRRTQSSAIATAQDGPDLFPLLPRVDQERDGEVPDPFAVSRSEHGRGQLERLLRVVQPHADMLHGFVGGLRDVHDVRRADSRLLEAMAALLGWRLKDNLHEEGQRNEIGFAAELYRSVGTTAAIGAMINRLTGWRAVARDFVRNVLVTWDPTRVEQLESGPAYLDGSARVEGSPPTLATRRVPHGTVDTADALAMQRLRDRDPADTTAFTYDCGRFDGALGGYRQDDTTWYNRETVGLYVTPPGPVDPAVVAETWRRTRALLNDFLPIQVRTILFVRP